MIPRPYHHRRFQTPRHPIHYHTVSIRADVPIHGAASEKYHPGQRERSIGGRNHSLLQSRELLTPSVLCWSNVTVLTGDLVAAGTGVHRLR